MRKRARTIIIYMVLGGLSAVLLASGLKLSAWRNEQTELYNQAVAAYLSGNMEEAVQLFEASVVAYGELGQYNDLENLIYGRASRELAALAHFHKAKALLALGQLRPAIESFMQSLRLNPGNDYSFLGVNLSDVSQLTEQALIVKYDLEMLFRENSSQPQQSQEGQEQSQEQGDDQLPATPPPGTTPQPGSGSGDGNQL